MNVHEIYPSRKDELQKQISAHNRRLQLLKERQAQQGISTDPSIITEIEDIETKIEELLVQLRELNDNNNVTKVSQAVPSDTHSASRYLPPKSYHRFVGRFDEQDRIISALHDLNHRAIITIIGLGGIGKTTLAREIVEECLNEDFFNHIVWTSFKTEYFISEDIAQIDPLSYSFDDLLSEIGRQCDQPNIAQMAPGQKRASVKSLLATKKILIVMDNLETVFNSEQLIDAVFQILGKSKLLITSRHHIKHEYVFTIDLDGLPEDEGVIFLREDSKWRGVEAVAQAGRPQLVEIHQITGGAPLAMKLVIGQMSRQPMSIVLNTLKKAAFRGQDYNFYRFIYQHSWEMLNLNAHMVLVDVSVFPPITGGAVMDVQSVSQVETSFFWEAMDQLVNLSLVDKIGPAGQERYALHPLTQYFIRSDITKEWGEQ